MELILGRNNKFIALWLQFFFSVLIHPSLKLDLFLEKRSWIFLYWPEEGTVSPCIFWWSKTNSRRVFWPKIILLILIFSLPSFLHPFFQSPSLFFNPSPPLCRSVSIRCDSRMCLFITFSERSPLADPVQFCLVTNSRESSEWQTLNRPSPLLTSKDGNGFSFLYMHSGRPRSWGSVFLFLTVLAWREGNGRSYLEKFPAKSRKPEILTFDG